MSASRPSEPWRQLPHQVADAIEPELPRMAADLLAAIATEVPEYARPLEGSFGRGLETGVTEALRQFLELIRDPDAGRGTGREVYVGLGRGELRQGRTLDSLQAAYRVGARVAWRRSATAVRAAGFQPEVLSLLAESMFAYIDELSADSVEGYAAAQSELEGERQRRRRELVALILSENPSPQQELRAAASAAGWNLPSTIAPLACREQLTAPLARRLGPDVIATSRDGFGCLIVPDPAGPGRRAAVERAASQLVEQLELATTAIIAFGPTLALAVPAVTVEVGSQQTPAGSVLTGARAWAVTVAALALPQVNGPIIDTDQHLAELILRESSDLVARLGELRMAPFACLTSGSRLRLSRTLLAYVENAGNAVAVAGELGIHPQTARHRIARLREHFGDDLDSPNWRFEVGLALRFSLAGQL